MGRIPPQQRAFDTYASRPPGADATHRQIFMLLFAAWELAFIPKLA
jgi:hypothetical protein